MGPRLPVVPFTLIALIAAGLGLIAGLCKLVAESPRLQLEDPDARLRKRRWTVASVWGAVIAGALVFSSAFMKALG